MCVKLLLCRLNYLFVDMERKTYRWCIVPQCKNTSKTTPNKLFIDVPRKVDIRKRWLHLAGRKCDGMSVTSPIYFCEDHFDLPNDMENYMRYHVMGFVAKVMLKPGCLPTKFHTTEVNTTLSLKMPEENTTSTEVKSALDSLEHYCLKNHLSRTQDYGIICKALEKDENLSLVDTKRLLAICVHDLREDIKFTATIMNIIPAILSRVQMGKYDPCPDLLPSALAVIHIIKTAALLSKVDSLKVLCYETLISYPEDTLIAVVEHYEEVLEIFNLYCHMRIPTQIRSQACLLLHKLLKILPAEKRTDFVEQGISVWFSKIIPTIMVHVQTSEDHEMPMEVLEILTDGLTACDYTNNQEWHIILECICDGKKYPAVMKTLLQNGSHFWHRLWIVFIRLLKHQITQSMGFIGTPINSMLPVVEAAFKVDVENRCKAFECWNVLIDSFATETNESNINKRIKLLIIPLKSNNAKAEATAIAKFKCWWHLLQKFQSKIEKFLDTILVSFLHFCFGRHNATDKSTIIPGQISVAVKQLCIQSIVDIVGHVKCDGCTDLPKLKGKLINTKNLVDNWNHWVFSMTSTIMMSANSDHGLTKQQMTCLWKSFLMTIGELPENNIRKDLFSEMLSILIHLVQQCKLNGNHADMVLNALVLSLFNGEMEIKTLLKSKTDTNDPLYKIISIILDPSLKLAYQSNSISELVIKLKSVTDIFLDPILSSPTAVVGWLLKTLPATDIGLILWISLVESICESRYNVCPQNLSNTMAWPLKSITSFTDIKLAAMTWYTAYDLVYVQLKNTDAFDKIVSKFLFNNRLTGYSTVYFKLCITLSVIKYKVCDKTVKYEKEVELLQILSAHIDSYQNFVEIFPILIDRVQSVISVLISNVNEILARNILICVKNMLTIMTQACNQQTDVSQILSLIGSLLKSLDLLYKVESYYKLIPIIVEDLIECASCLSKQSSIKNTFLSVMKTFASKIVETDDTFDKIKEIIDRIENVPMELDKNKKNDKNEFTTPKLKEAPKKTKKKEASIVNTVVENGEEYVVVNSHWKFNPRKLTEYQKEKLQRKREDIPALYQDLSQSQDEFKLVTWKTDSQDTSNSSKSESKSLQSGCNETTPQILTNLPSSNVVPKILENFFSENAKKDSPAKDLLPVDTSLNKVQATTPKNTKSPRMALKDRVFRNVRNLMEKSGVQKENKDESEDLNKTVNIIKTPTQSKCDDAVNVVNSAPPLLSADRPSRVKRKPKKFDELQLLSAKKKRQALKNLKSDAISTATKTDTNKNDNVIDKLGSPIVSVPDEASVNIPGDSQAAENEIISGSNELIQTNELILKDVEIHNSTVEINEEQTIEIKNTEQHSKNLDSSPGINKKCEKTNESKEECTDRSEVEMSNMIENIKPTEEHLNTSNNNKEGNMSTEVQGQNSDSKKDEKSNDKIDEETVIKTDQNLNESTSPNINSRNEISTLQQTPKNKVTEETKTTAKKNSVKKSRIEKELAIDMVEGHPFLKMQSQKRLTRKALESTATGRRKSLVAKLNKSKIEANGTVKSDKKTKDKSKESDRDRENSSFTVEESQDKDTEIIDRSSSTEDLPYSDDVIESSQDSSITTISVKSTKKSNKKIPVVTLHKINLFEDKNEQITESQSILDCVIVTPPESSKPNQESKDDIELSQNKTAVEEVAQDLTENMDTEPIDEMELSVIVIDDNVPAPLTISSDETEVGPETQEIAEADTQPTDPKDFMDIDVAQDDLNKISTAAANINEICSNKDKVESPTNEKSITEKPVNPSDNTTITLSESACADLENEAGASSPSSFREEVKRKQDFLNNTLEISPIKNMSPERAKKSPSPETSSDYVVIKLSSPVQSNGEPFEKCGSPEVFTEEKVSPDKRDQSPPRVEVTVINTSPSSSLSLKKNRPQMRSGGRAAQMLGLCVPDKLQAIINPDKNETEEIKNANTFSTPARRNLRILYNSASEDTEVVSENDDSENFLKFRRSLPAIGRSPSGPILKRKLIEIADDATMSPASKRKRVSFHDPPVSTTISVQKYIEPGGVRSPQNSAHKRLERQLRQYTPSKSPKRLDHAFKLDTVLTKAIESFSETDVISVPDDTQQFSLDETPVVEIVRASELNDTDPICPELLECNDPIDNIAGELSSSAMKSLLVQELVGKVETVGDLAKMTELEVNRLCIKAPKVKVAKKVLSDYASKRVEKPTNDVMVTIDEAIFDEPMPDPDLKVDIEIQTDRNTSQEMEIQTDATPTTVSFVQTETTPIAHTVVQTDESGSKSTADIIKVCLAERPDFVEQVGVHLVESSIKQIADKLPFSALTDVLMNKVNSSDTTSLLNRILDNHCDGSTENRSSKELSFIRDYIRDRFAAKDLVLFCSQVLKTVYDKPES